jgi:hypothetical protein
MKPTLPTTFGNNEGDRFYLSPDHSEQHPEMFIKCDGKLYLMTNDFKIVELEPKRQQQ